MPEGNPPTNELNLYLVFSEGIGAFGPTLQEITRIGLNKIRYVQGANRGETTTVRAIHFVETEGEAIEHLKLVSEQQGKEMVLRSTSTDKWWTVFLKSSSGFYLQVDGTNPEWNYIVKYNLTVQRTK